MTSKKGFRCSFCGGHVTAGHRVTQADDTSEPVVVVRNVPAQVCNQCGERFFTADVAARLSKLVQDARAAQEGKEGIVELRYAILEAA